MAVSTVHEEYLRMSEYWKLMTDVTSSQKVIQDLGTEYLPQLNDQEDAEYAAYKARASFPMFTEHVLNTFIGMVMRKDPLLDNVPELYKKNIDGAGTSLKKYISKLVKSVILYRRSASFVDYSDRAKILLYPAEAILNWKTSVIAGVEKLTLVVLRENISNYGVDEFNFEDEYQYRVLTLEPEFMNLERNDPKQKFIYRQRLFDADENLIAGSDIRPQSKFKNLDFIPIEIHGGVMPDYPPLISIAEQNIAWYRLDADYKHGLHYVALPTPYTIGVDPEDEFRPKTIGSERIWYLPEGARAGMLEFKGAGLGAIAAAKEETYESIITLSSRILAPPTAMNETATAANIRNAGETASLAALIGQLSEEVTRVINYAVNWSDTVNNIKAIINTDFIPVILSGSDVASYVASQLKGGMSQYTLFNVLKRGEIQKGDRTFEDEVNDILKERLERDALELKQAQELARIGAKNQKKSTQEKKQEKSGQQPVKKQNQLEN